MTRPRLLGEIVEKDGCICLQVRPDTWYPLGGNSGIASDFEETFGCVMPCDIGKRVYRVGEILQMENTEQLAASLKNAHNPDTNPNWTPKIGRRVYSCVECGTEQALSTNHTGTVWAANCAGRCRDVFNANTSREIVQWHPARQHKYIREA